MNWLNTATSTSADHLQYSYDRNGNELYKNNLVNPDFSELYHTSGGNNNSGYDPLNRLTGFARGGLSSSGNNGSSLDSVTAANRYASLGIGCRWEPDPCYHQWHDDHSYFRQPK